MNGQSEKRQYGEHEQRGCFGIASRMLNHLVKHTTLIDKQEDTAGIGFVVATIYCQFLFTCQIYKYYR